MRRSASMACAALLGAALAGGSVAAQGRGGMGMGVGMMSARDSGTAAQMLVIHELTVNHERIRRSVTNLPDGIRTVTESDDPRLARLIREHVATMDSRVRKGDDPGLPMESPALHAIFLGNDKIRTTVDTTASGMVVVQTSTDKAVVASLQQHAAEVTDLAERGMTAMHEAMMKNMPAGGTMPGGGMMGGGGRMGGGAMAGMRGDSGFAAMQARGKLAMGVDQYTSTHRFDERSDGGRIELQRDVPDTAGVAAIRRHLQGIASAFGSGDFSTPAFVHLQDAPGAKVMAAKRTAITYTYRDLPRGGEFESSPGTGTRSRPSTSSWRFSGRNTR